MEKVSIVSSTTTYIKVKYPDLSTETTDRLPLRLDSGFQDCELALTPSFI